MTGSKFTRVVGTLFFLAGMVFLIGFWWARSTGRSETGLLFGRALQYTMYALIACAAYMGLVGVYHTILAVFGLDGEPGIFSSGKRTGPLSGPQADGPPAGRPPSKPS